MYGYAYMSVLLICDLHENQEGDNRDVTWMSSYLFFPLKFEEGQIDEAPECYILLVTH